MNYPIRDLIIASLTTVITIYGTWNVFTEMLKTILPFGLFIAGALFCAGHFLRVPAPSVDIVEQVLGKSPHVATDNENFIMRSVAHRGAGLDAPENSLAAFKMCNDNGCKTIEFDVTLTKDDVPIVFHDSSLERMTDLKLVIAEQNWSELSNIDISVKHVYKDRFVKTNIPTLEQVVTQLLAAGQRMFIDIKDNNMKFVKIIHDLFEHYPNLYSRAVVSSFYPNIIYFIRKGNPKIVCSLAWRPHAFAYDSFSFPQGKGQRRSNIWYKHWFLQICDSLHEWALQKFTYYILGLSAILLHKDVMSGKAVLEWQKRGIRVIAWTANTPVEKQYFARVLKVTYLTDTLTGEGTTHSTI